MHYDNVKCNNMLTCSDFHMVGLQFNIHWESEHGKYIKVHYLVTGEYANLTKEVTVIKNYTEIVQMSLNSQINIYVEPHGHKTVIFKYHLLPGLVNQCYRYIYDPLIVQAVDFTLTLDDLADIYGVNMDCFIESKQEASFMSVGKVALRHGPFDS